MPAHNRNRPAAAHQETGGLSEIARAISGCTICKPVLPLGPRPILQAEPEARILIAAQAPGRKAHHSGLPFDDASGERLRDWLGVSRELFYDARRFAIVPMGFCFPGTAQSGDRPPRPECARTWRRKLLEQLSDIELTLAVGRYAQAYHCQSRAASLTEVVASWQKWWPELVPLPHPSPRNQAWLKRNPWFGTELLPALRRRVSEVLSG